LNKKFSVPDISQSHIFEQYTTVLCRVAKKHPMVVILDDLHWADTATCELLLHSLAGLAEISLAEGNLEEVGGYVEQILEKFDPNLHRDPEGRSKILLDCYNVLKSINDVRSTTVLQQAYRLMMDHAGQYEDEDCRKSFLENVCVNQQICNLVKLEASDPPDL
jgi:hypothetical protein